jgi:hypothetical protein
MESGIEHAHQISIPHHQQNPALAGLSPYTECAACIAALWLCQDSYGEPEKSAKNKKRRLKQPISNA